MLEISGYIVFLSKFAAKKYADNINLTLQKYGLEICEVSPFMMRQAAIEKLYSRESQDFIETKCNVLMHHEYLCVFVYGDNARMHVIDATHYEKPHEVWVPTSEAENDQLLSVKEFGGIIDRIHTRHPHPLARP